MLGLKCDLFYDYYGIALWELGRKFEYYLTEQLETRFLVCLF